MNEIVNSPVEFKGNPTVEYIIELNREFKRPKFSSFAYLSLWFYVIFQGFLVVWLYKSVIELNTNLRELNESFQSVQDYIRMLQDNQIADLKLYDELIAKMMKETQDLEGNVRSKREITQTVDQQIFDALENLSELNKSNEDYVSDEDISAKRHLNTRKKVTDLLESTTWQPMYERRSRVMVTSKEKTNEDESKKRILEQISSALQTISKEDAKRFRSKKKIRRPITFLSQQRKSVEVEEFEPPLVQPSCNMYAIQYVADTSNYTLGVHQNYDGNGRKKIVNGFYTDWKPTHWSHRLKVTEKFHLHDGQVTIYEEGLYLVYAQIHYSDTHDANGYRIYRNSESISQCTVMAAHPDEAEIKSNTCYTGLPIYLHKNDKIFIKDIHNSRFVILKQEKSFFGLVKLGDIKIQN